MTEISQQTLHILSSWVRCGVSIVRIWEKIDRVNTAPHGTYVHIDGLVQGRRNSYAIALEPSPPTPTHQYTRVSKDHFIFIYMYECIYNSWYPQ